MKQTRKCSPKNTAPTGTLDIAKAIAEQKAAGVRVFWYGRFMMRGEDPAKPTVYRISKEDAIRMGAHLDNNRRSEDTCEFFVFDSDDRVVAINLDHLVFWQTLFDAAAGPPQKARPDIHPGAVDVYFAGMKEPLEFEVESDGEYDEEEPENDEGQFRCILDCLQTGGLFRDEFIEFDDEDGETAYLRVGDIARLEVAKNVVYPKYEDEELGDEEPQKAVQ